MSDVSALRRQEILAALRRGAVPTHGLDALAVGLEHFESAIDEELDRVAQGAGAFKAVRGEYGAGKTFFIRWLQHRSMSMGFATAEVQVSETETPLHRLETVYRRAMERLRVRGSAGGALGDVVDRWFLALESDAEQLPGVDPDDDAAVEAAIAALMEKRLARIARDTPQLATALRAYHRLQVSGDVATAQGLLSWLAGQPNVAASIKRSADLKGDIDHFGALSFLEGLLVVLRDSGQRGLVLVLDEVETLQRVRADAREKSLNALRQLIDEVEGGRFPGLYLIITGTPAFYDGPQGVQRLAPLAQRLHTDFSTDARFDNPRAVQLRLTGMDQAGLVSVGLRIRDLFVAGAHAPDRVRSLVDDAYVADLASAVAGDFGGHVRVAPRVFLKKLVADVLDRVDQFPDFDPRAHYRLTIDRAELTPEERVATGLDDIDLEF